jgi:hypothetical protein
MWEKKIWPVYKKLEAQGEGNSHRETGIILEPRQYIDRLRNKLLYI